MSPDTQRVRDHSHDRRYFTMVPHIVTDMLASGELTPLDFALYVYLRRHCGEHGDVYTESVRESASRLHVSVGSIFTARKRLVDSGLVELNLVGTLGHEVAEITIRDVWPENMERYAPKRAPGGPGEGEGLRSNIERKSTRASGQVRTQTAVGVQILNASVRDCVQPVNALSLEQKEKNVKKEKPEDAVACAPSDGLEEVAAPHERVVYEPPEQACPVKFGCSFRGSYTDHIAAAHRLQREPPKRPRPPELDAIAEPVS